MIRCRDDHMGRCSVDVELANGDDLDRASAGEIPSDQIRRLTVRGVVDSGATRLLVPEYVARQLGLETAGQTLRPRDPRWISSEME